jgi:hypothetical protein
VAFLLEKRHLKEGEGKMVTREEIIVAVKDCAAKLGRTPSLGELRIAANINAYQVRIRFGNYMLLLKDAGLDATGQGHPVEPRALFLDWAEIVRRLKKIPTIAEYERDSKYSVRPLAARHCGWRKVAAGMRDYLIENRLEVEWDDVMKLVTEHLQPPGKNSIFSKTSGLPSKPKIQTDQPVYGQSLLHFPMTYAPTNENGVIFAFGSVARELGFSILRIQAGFPDCEAMREVEPGRCQRKRIEFEYESRNFMAHMHPISGCDLIVCWHNNWPECPLEVIELSSLIGNLKKLTTD